MLVFTDRATEMVHLVPTGAKATAIDTATQFVVNVVKYHGLQRSLISDRNKITLSTFWTHVCAMLDYQSYTTTSFYPQCNGQAELTVQTVKQFLRTATLKGLNWFKWLAVAELSINSAPISHTNIYLFRLNCGFDPGVFPDVYNLDSPVNTRSENVRPFIDRMRSEVVAARAILSDLQCQNIAQANKHRHGHSFHVGDWAFGKMTTQQRTQLAAACVLGLKCAGTYKITRQVRHNTLELALPSGVRIHPLFNTLHIVPYHMGPQGVPDVVVPLKALPQEVLDSFHQPFLEDGQLSNAFNNY